jgi:hypothetical protein
LLAAAAEVEGKQQRVLLVVAAVVVIGILLSVNHLVAVLQRNHKCLLLQEHTQ